jgi:hypothetical protein
MKINQLNLKKPDFMDEFNISKFACPKQNFGDCATKIQ